MIQIYLDPKQLIEDLSTELAGLISIEAEETWWSDRCPNAIHSTQEHVLQELLQCCYRDIEWAKKSGAKGPQFYIEKLLTSTDATGWSIFFNYDLGGLTGVSHLLVKCGEDDFLLRYHSP